MRRNIPKRLRLTQNWCRKLSLRHNIYPQKSSLPPSLASDFPNKFIRVSPEVEEAVQSGKPVVALETTIYTHGFPYPDNVALASHLESVVRLNGGVPATIGILNGVARVGLDPKELVELSSAAGKPETMKVSRRDLPYITGLGIAGKKINGGTTISGTMILAQMVGIEVFGTGGLGGVHRGGEDSMDISADLTELGRTPVAVISSGCKGFLDIPRTLEYLETQGVTVGTFADGRRGSIEFPAFWTRDSGVKSPLVVQDEEEAAAIIYSRRLLGISSGLLFANPIPSEYSISKSEIDIAIEEAVQDAEKCGIFGHANTPFILARIKDLTKGRSIPVNRVLIESNVTRATRVAVELAKLGLASGSNNSFISATQGIVTRRPHQDSISQHEGPTETRADILIAGSIAIDFSCDYTPFGQDSGKPPVPHTSNPATISQSVGGVGHNVSMAAHLASANNSVRLCTLVADDMPGQMIISFLRGRGLDTSGIRTLALDPKKPVRTAQYIAINDQNKDLVIAMADMKILGDAGADFDQEWLPLIKSAQPKWVIIDANWGASTIGEWLKAAKLEGARVAFEPVSVPKSRFLFPTLRGTGTGASMFTKNIYPIHSIDLATPNAAELAAMHGAAKAHEYFEHPDWWKTIDAFGIPSSGARDRFQALVGKECVDIGVPQMIVQLLPYIPTIIAKLGADGVVLATILSPESSYLTSPRHAPYILSRNATENTFIGGVYMRHFPAVSRVPIDDIVSVNGVGDTFLGVLVAGLAQGLEILDERLIELAQRAAILTLKCREAVAPEVADLRKELEELGKGGEWNDKLTTSHYVDR